MSFFIDTGGNDDDIKSVPLEKELPKEIADILSSVKNTVTVSKPISKIKSNTLDNFANNLSTILNNKREKTLNRYDSSIVLSDTKQDTVVSKVLEKSKVLSDPNFEILKSVPNYDISDKKLKKIKQIERSKTKGQKWFDLPATEVTDEIKRDLEVLQMRSVLDPKHFYKKNDLKVLPKYFQIGKVMDSPLDYYNNRCTKKERKRTLVDELLADAEFNKYNKRKYLEIIEERRKTSYKAHQRAKKLKRKNK
ncbi:deoxynucleotidyltransferase terminal-interacting protein 2 [Chrysoperla carnea]|uniref:deoxynucleotidyltransferase terminal-interacting protein 2 n=1 Tax=Chrysoperla carnea TaxID=189513 RepID=UPI001D061200|nr:deoxynucleotidyltransferase terminal-interacting protein 2 [Chrysoperla carnea]